MTGTRVRPIDTSKHLPGTAMRAYLDHLNEVLEASQRDLVRAPAARAMLHATLRHWARTANRAYLERFQDAGLSPARYPQPLPPPSTHGVPDGDLARVRARRVLVEHGWLIVANAGTHPALHRAEIGQPFGTTGNGAA